MIAALDLIAFQPAHGQRQLAVQAGILDRDRPAILHSVENDLLAEHLDLLQVGRTRQGAR
jgi:hypothetical protein